MLADIIPDADARDAHRRSPWLSLAQCLETQLHRPAPRVIAGTLLQTRTSQTQAVHVLLLAPFSSENPAVRPLVAADLRHLVGSVEDVDVGVEHEDDEGGRGADRVGGDATVYLGDEGVVGEDGVGDEGGEGGWGDVAVDEDEVDAVAVDAA